MADCYESARGPAGLGVPAGPEALLRTSVWWSLSRAPADRGYITSRC